MKKLIMIGGAMGTGKTTSAEILVNSVPNSVMLDGDWCWQQGCDWHFDQESKDMALRNICFLLESFLKNSHIENVFFAWVLHLPETHKHITETLRARGCTFELIDLSLTIYEHALRKRLEGRSRAEAERQGLPFCKSALDELVARTMDRACYFKDLDTIKIDVSKMTPGEVATKICEHAEIEIRTS